MADTKDQAAPATPVKQDEPKKPGKFKRFLSAAVQSIGEALGDSWTER